MDQKKLLGLSLKSLSKNDILEEIKKFLTNPGDFFHIVSLNPENLVIAGQNHEFKKVLETAQIQIMDGIGIVLAARLLGVSPVNRTSGVDLMLDLLKLANERRLRVMLIGGRPKIADRVVDCQQKKFSQVKFFSLEGIKDIKNPQKKEEEKIFTIVSRFKPHFVFVAFGSPAQELWLDKNREKFKGVVGMGVGGAFDYLAGVVPRAPLLLRRLGLEWLFRLLIQPWRWRRQLRLLKFLWLIFWEVLGRLFIK